MREIYFVRSLARLFTTNCGIRLPKHHRSNFRAPIKRRRVSARARALARMLVHFIIAWHLWFSKFQRGESHHRPASCRASLVDTVSLWQVTLCSWLTSHSISSIFIIFLTKRLFSCCSSLVLGDQLIARPFFQHYIFYVYSHRLNAMKRMQKWWKKNVR